MIIFLGWLFILWAAYLAFKHRHNFKNEKKIVIGIVALLLCRYNYAFYG